MSRLEWSKVLFILIACLVFAGLLSPSLALAAGIAFGVTFVHPFAKLSRHWSKLLLQGSVVALGFGMNFGQVVAAGRASFLYTAIGISFAMAVGFVLGKVFNVTGKAAFLITAGTAICGGSAIAAIAPITNPLEEELAMSLGTVFTLNSVALFLFPVIGAALHLTQTQFGLWSALAIHDTSSVVGAAAKFGPGALAVGTVVKLTRALWIVPVALLTAFFKSAKDTDARRQSGEELRPSSGGAPNSGPVLRGFLRSAKDTDACRRSGEELRPSSGGAPNPGPVLRGFLRRSTARVRLPWFILFFCLAAIAKTWLPNLGDLFAKVNHAGHIGLALTLFLIGTGISIRTVRQAGSGVMAQGVVLWIIVASASLIAIRTGWVHL